MAACDLSWLPALFELSGEWAPYCERLYESFSLQFLGTSKPLFRGRQVTAPWRQQFAGDGKSGTFWHLISQGGKELERIPDIRRCERIPWVRSLIEASENPRVNTWQDQSRGDARWKIAVEDYSYLLVLGDHGSYLRLITAFHLERNHQREKLSDEHDLARADVIAKSSRPPSR